jgi:hypothetical protein
VVAELGQKMASAPARRRSPRSSTLLLSFSSASRALLALGPACRNLHRGDASVATRASGTHTRSPSLALVSAARSSPASPEFACPARAELNGALLRKTGCMLPKPQKKRQPTEPREPLEEIQMDFKDVSSVSAEQSRQGKRQQVIEVGNFVDAGPSIALFAQAREDFHEQTAMEAMISFLQTSGRPHQITFEHDPRWVGSGSGRDFPSPLRRLLGCRGITPAICPPHRPDKNASGERYHRPYGQECLQIHRPRRSRRWARSQRRFLGTPTKNVPTRDEPVAMSRLVWPFRRCLPSHPSLSGLTQMPG